MNKDIQFEAISERLYLHAGQNLEAYDFESIFPELEFHHRVDTDAVTHICDCFQIDPSGIWQVSSYGNSPETIYVLLERILVF